LKILLGTISTLLFIIHQFIQWGLGIHIPILDSYLDPFLAMPILLLLLDWEMEWIWTRPKLSASELIASFIIFSLIFEWLFPFLSAEFTGDIWDVFAYFLGGFVYYIAREYDDAPQPLK
jgi:hypothetical protein